MGSIMLEIEWEWQQNCGDGMRLGTNEFTMSFSLLYFRKK